MDEEGLIQELAGKRMSEASKSLRLQDVRDRERDCEELEVCTFEALSEERRNLIMGRLTRRRYDME